VKPDRMQVYNSVAYVLHKNLYSNEVMWTVYSPYPLLTDWKYTIKKQYAVPVKYKTVTTYDNFLRAKGDCI
jgi:hypothetical protein